MTRIRHYGLALAFVPLALAAVPAPAGNHTTGCGVPAISDPDIRASFERFDRNQSAGASAICAMLLNNADAVSPTR